MENTFPTRSDLIASELEVQLRQLLERVSLETQLTCIVDEGPKSQEMGAFLNHFTSLNPHLHCTFLKAGEDPAQDAMLDAALLPATGVGAVGAGARMVFHGIPGGKEISSFAAAVLNAGGGAKEVDKYTLKDMMKIRKPMELQVCVSLACHHCAQLVAGCQRIAWENPQVTAHMIDANLYPQIVKQYQIERVPLLVVNRGKTFPGGKTMAELTGLLSKIK